MLKRLITIAFLITIAGFAASFLNKQPGMTTLEWLGWRVEARTSLLVVIAVGIIWLAIMLDRIIGVITGLPGRISGSLNSRRQEQGHQALAIGLVAASAGDGREAMRQSKKAKRLMGEAPLTDLLSAQAASLTGDPDAASRYFETLAEHRETAFFGKAGLMRLEAERGDDNAALAIGREAFALNQKAPGLAKALYALEAQHGHWEKAIDALHAAARDPDMDSKAVNRGFATLYYKLAEDDQHHDRGDGAVLAHLNKALKYDAGLPPAVLAAATLHHAMGKPRKARNVLQAGFHHTPHPDVAMALFDDLGGDEAALSKLIKITDQGGNHPDALVDVARLAMGQKLWGEAKRLLDMVPEESRDLKTWQVYADLAEHAPKKSNKDKDGDAASAEWPQQHYALTMAAKAKRPAAWQCSSCHGVAEDWHAHCPDCGHFATVGWR